MKIVTIVTTKNRLELFEKAFQSVTSQSRKSDKIIVVSDSTDENFDKELAIIGENAELIKDTYTHNYAGSLNTVIHNIIETNLFDYVDYDNIYIATLDDDDAWDNDYLAKCENAVTSQQDFVVSGITYCNENGNNCLSIPHELCIDSFLSGNPHIQGSNTFIKFSTLLKAGIENALVKDITAFLLELGTGFAFLGHQYHLTVGGDDFYINLLFYNINLR